MPHVPFFQLYLLNHRQEIRSGTVVTYNDRQEILCQTCTDIALNEGEEKVEESTKSHFSDSPPGQQMNRETREVG